MSCALSPSPGSTVIPGMNAVASGSLEGALPVLSHCSQPHLFLLP